MACSLWGHITRLCVGQTTCAERCIAMVILHHSYMYLTIYSALTSNY